MLGLNGKLEQLCAELNLPAFRARQIKEWIFDKYVDSFSEMTNLPARLREQLSLSARIVGAKLQKVVRTKDGTYKLLVEYADGATVEAVLIKYRTWSTVCLSTQVGCAQECAFCASATLGLERNLSHGDLVEQLWHSFRYCTQEGLPIPRNVVLMGIGEPLANLANVIKFIRTANDPEFFGIGQRRFTLSTAGLIPQINRLSEEGLGITLAISLHAPNDELRTALMPLNAKNPLQDLIPACRNYTEVTGRRVTYEYMLLDGINDRDEHASQLVRLLRGENCLVNLIPFNQVPGKDFKPGKDPGGFRDKLTAGGLNATIRRSLGDEISAACGQLRRGELK